MIAAVDHQPLDLVEHRRVGRVAVGAIDPARRDDAERRALRLPSSGSAPARCACAAHRGLVSPSRGSQVEGVLHRPRRMVLRHVERGEIVPFVLDLRPLGDREAEVGENLGKLVHHLADRVDRAADAFRRRQRQVDRLGRQLAIELRRLQRRLALGDRRRDRSRAARGSSAPRRRASPASIPPSDFSSAVISPDLPSIRHAQRLDRAEVGRVRDFVENFGVRRHVAASSRAAAQNAKPCARTARMSDWPEPRRPARSRDARDPPSRGADARQDPRRSCAVAESRLARRAAARTRAASRPCRPTPAATAPSR